VSHSSPERSATAPGARLADYKTALTTPTALPPVLLSVLARLPIGMNSLALLLYVRRATGSFATAGLVSAAALVGVAVGSVIQGRIMDRHGPSRPLYVLAVLATLIVSTEVYAVESHAPDGVLVGLAFGIGLTGPAVGSASRSLWVRLLPPGPVRQAAYAYEAISMEVFFILGPGLAGLMSALPLASTGLVVATGCTVVGGLGFALTPAVRRWRPAADQPRPASLLGALTSHGMRTLTLAGLGFGLTIGFIEVAVPAVATAAGRPEISGVLLSLMSISSVLFGVFYGTRPWPRSLQWRLPTLLAGFSVLAVLPAVPTTLFWLGATLLVTGMLITPQATAHSATIDVVAPVGTTAEAFGWLITAITLGLALGQSASGQLVESRGPSLSFLAATLSGLIIAGLLWLFRRTLSGQPSAIPEPVSVSGRSD